MSQSIVSGRVFEADGSAVPGVSISAFKNGEPFSFPEDETPIQLNDDGIFEISLPTEEEVTLNLNATGFATQVVPIKSPSLEDGKVSIDVMMIARGKEQIVNASTGGTITGADGASITINGGSFVDQEGNPLADSDNIVITVSPVDISTPAGIILFPGLFSGFPEGETTEFPIEPYGLVEFHLTLQSTGEKVQLGENMTAKVAVPLYIKENQSGDDFPVGGSFPMWSLALETGIWNQEGTGLVVSSADSPTGLIVEFDAPHLSWWNNDLVTTNPAMATVTVVDTQGMIGTAVIFARSINRLDEGTFEVNETTPPLIVASNVETCFWATIIFNDGTEGTTAEQCVTPGPNENINIILGLSPIPLDITASPSLTGPIAGNIGSPIQIIQLRPASKETEVSYEILSGNLPTGMSLSPISSTGANITGTPNEAGDFTVEIKGTDSEGNMDFITLTYSILETSCWEVIETPEGLSLGKVTLAPTSCSTISDDYGWTKVDLSYGGNPPSNLFLRIPLNNDHVTGLLFEPLLVFSHYETNGKPFINVDLIPCGRNCPNETRLDPFPPE
jgi:hypothetical protein